MRDNLQTKDIPAVGSSAIVLRLPRVTLYHADCRQLLPELSGIDAILTDPPYGVGFNYAAKRTRKSLLAWGRGASKAEHDRGWSNVIGDDTAFDPGHLLNYGEIILWGANNYASRLPDSRGWLIWDKLGDKAPSAFGDCEMAWTNKDMSIRIHRQLWRGIVREGEENVANGAKLHPAQKPYALMAWCLGFLDGTVICDPYMGSGTTGLAAIRARRQFIGIEKDETHFKTACERLQRELAQGVML